jgi:hypothetical protein
MGCFVSPGGLNLLLGPKPNFNAAYELNVRFGYLLFVNPAVQCVGADAEKVSDLSRGISRHV